MNMSLMKDLVHDRWNGIIKAACTVHRYQMLEGLVLLQEKSAPKYLRSLLADIKNR